MEPSPHYDGQGPLCSSLDPWHSITDYIQSAARRRQWHPTPVLLPGKSHGWRSLVGCSHGLLRVRHDWATSISRTEEENGTPLQCSCLENPRDGEPGGLLSMGLHRVGHD